VRRIGALQGPRRQERDVCLEMRLIGMQLPAEVLDELSHWTLHVRDQRMPEARHIQLKIIARSVVYNRKSR
jgi:hypothetical protein